VRTTILAQQQHLAGESRGRFPVAQLFECPALECRIGLGLIERFERK
jgi:hypothetical protein